MTRPTFLAHRATVILMAVAVLVATGDGFAQSYAGLYRWAIEHDLTGWKAESFPLLVDLFIAVGELGLFALALEGHRLRKSGLSWADVALPFGIASAGWGVSLVFNVGAVGHDFADQATAAVPPVASMLGLLVLLRTLHRLVTTEAPPETATEPETLSPVRWPLPELESADQSPVGYDLWDTIKPEPEKVDADLAPVVATARDRYADDLAAGTVPSVRRIRRELRVGHPRAKRIHAALTEGAA
ncbi:DUF2637 domain-containing protein [Spirillospora sp. NPDC048911]|uniref:DUF2637 domain-containing protein n=1 Tax=Spirillospora sp. NPDC048911 TaxID=3364527 RepID=UPI0037206326